MEKIDWCFPPTGGGIEAGVNDAGIVTFDGAPLANLAREALQNSVDARDDRDRPVGVTFEIREIAVSEFGGPSLSEHVVACADEWKSDTKARRVLDKARNLLADSTLPMLGIIDTNTKGLAGTSWRGLVKVTGASFKLSESAGGSFGVGKAAPFTLSPLRTVCYWSLFREGSGLVERFQGKAVLLSHHFESGHGEEMTQATGFYGRVQGCEALDGPDVPETFRPNKGENEQGTAIWIIGFNPEQEGERWQHAIARSVVSNFFYAIARGDLEVLLEPDEDATDDYSWQIDAKSLDHLFQSLSNDENDEEIQRAKLYWRVSRRDPTEVWSDRDFGSVKLWIGTADEFPDDEIDLPSRVALIRQTGMLITDEQARQRFRGLRDYVAVCVFDDDRGNEFLRRMENPAHNQFEYSRLDDDAEKDRGRKALERLRNWLREQLVAHASPKPSDVSDEVDELVEYLYDDKPGPFEVGQSKTEPEFGVARRVDERRPPRQRLSTKPALDEEDNEAADGDGAETGTLGGAGTGNGGGQGNGGGTGEGGGEGGTGHRSGSRGKRPFNLRDVRILLDPADRCRGRICFTALETGMASLSVEEVGDSSSISREDVVISRMSDGTKTPVQRLAVNKGVRYELFIEGENDLDAAWQIRASSIEAEE
ncbi:MAG: hypothetical protein F4029_03025 [Gammaproteobacteria bacterium]|nr:hypothetical protein [Gammaproteobacteria bacterium]MYK45182.1 hypothetical protein [Gammaproteobacteria bacterium]